MAWGIVMADMELMPDSSEVVQYDRADIPLYIRRGELSSYPDKRALSHWHEDFEFIRVWGGRMNYFISGKTVLLEEGDCLFVNSRHPHYGYAYKDQDCRFLCVLIHPGLLTGSSVIYNETIRDFQDDSAVPYIHFRSGDNDGRLFGGELDHVWQIKERGRNGYELEAVGTLTKIFATLCNEKPQREILTEKKNGRLICYKLMVAWISSHYAENVSLDDIASSANVSKSTCCRMFKEYSGQSPYEFLITYRLHRSCEMLRGTERSVTEISNICGFNNSSYFSKLFMERYGCQPHRYRNAGT